MKRITVRGTIAAANFVLIAVAFAAPAMAQSLPGFNFGAFTQNQSATGGGGGSLTVFSPGGASYSHVVGASAGYGTSSIAPDGSYNALGGGAAGVTGLSLGNGGYGAAVGYTGYGDISSGSNTGYVYPVDPYFGGKG